jgi:hypothetical protein
MTATIVTVSLTLALSSFGLGHEDDQQHDHHHPHHLKVDHIVPPGPGDGWGFPNGNPDQYGWVDYGVDLPLGSDRTAEYFFPRYLAIPPEQMFLQTYYNPFETRGQRFLPFVAAGGDHPAGGPPVGSASLPVSPYANEPDTPVVRIPRFSGRVEGGPVSGGGPG